jgi:hypothetical protein
MIGSRADYGEAAEAATLMSVTVAKHDRDLAGF